MPMASIPASTRRQIWPSSIPPVPVRMRLAEAELKLTATVLTYARHVQAGRFPYTRVSRNIELPQAPPEPVDMLGRIAQAADAGKALDAFGPQHEPYRRLKAMLAELRASPASTGSRPADRHRHRQHGALALVSARPRQRACAGQPARLHAQGDARRPSGVDHPHRHRQAQHADAAAERDHEIASPSTRPGTCRPRSCTTNICRRWRRIRPCSRAWACG